MRRARLPAAALAFAALGAPAAAPAAPPVLAVRASRLLLADGSTVAEAVIVLKGGAVAAMGGGIPIPREARVLDAAVAAPGFADLWTSVPGGHDAEDPRPFAPGLRVADGLDPADPGARSGAREGVLYRVVLASDRNPLGGRAAAARAAGPRGMLALAAADAGGTISVTEAAARRDRFPGSLAGILEGIGAGFDAAARSDGEGAAPEGDGEFGPGDREALRALAGGKSPAWIFARSRAEVRAALDISARRRLAPTLVDPRCSAAELLAAARGAGLEPSAVRAVLALEADDPAYRLEAAGALAAAGVRVAFGSGGGRDADALRFMAALAVRHGMDPERARGALLGRGFDLPGRSPQGLVVGGPADLVLLDGDPIDPASRVLSVIAGGEPVARDRPGAADGRKRRGGRE